MTHTRHRVDTQTQFPVQGCGIVTGANLRSEGENMSTSELSGSWIYRSFNPKYGTATQEDELVLADAVLTLRSSAQAGDLQGTVEWPGGGLDLNGTFVSGPEI